MRPRSRVFRPCLEALEERAVLATFVSAAGSLTISKPVGNLLVETTASPGQIKVTDNVVTFFNGITKNLNIFGRTSGGSTNDLITFHANANPFQGNVLIDSGQGDDMINISGTVNGNLTINPGFGVDTVTANSSAVTVGKSFKFTDAGGTTSVLDMNNKNFSIGKDLSVTGVTTFNMGAANFLHVGGALSVVGNADAVTKLTASFSGLETTVGGNFKIAAGALDDVLSVTSKFSVGGKADVQFGQGANTVVLTPAAGGTGIAKDLNYAGLDGVDVVVFGANSLVGGKTKLSLGNGVNTFVDTATSAYKKDLAINAGFNTNTAVVTGVIDGGFSMTLADGGAGNTTVFTGKVGAGKKITYRGGNGGTLETFTLAPAAAATLLLDVRFGNGDSTFNLGPNATLDGKVTGTGGAYTFNPGTATLLPSFKQINYP